MASDLKLTVQLGLIDKALEPIKQLTQGSGKLATAFRTSKERLKDLNKQQADVRAYRVANVEASKQARAIRDLTTKSRGYSQALEEQRAVHTNLRGNLKAAQTQYNKLSRAMINGKGGSAEFQRELQKAQITLTASRTAFERSNTSIKTYRERLRNADDRLGRLNQQHKNTQDRLSGLKTRLDTAGIGTDGLRSKAQTLRQEQERMNQTLDRQRAALERVNAIQQRNKQLNERHAKTMGRAAMVGAAGYAGVAVGRNILTRSSSALAPGVDYAAQMSELQAITRLDKEDQRMATLRAQARELGATTAFTAADVGAGQTFLARAGFSPEAIHASMQDMLNLALANGVDLGRTADIASNISSAFKIDPEMEGNIGRVADVLSGTAARSNVNLEMLGETMKYLGGAEDLKLSLEEAATMAGLMGNIGIQGSQAGTAMRAMMNRLTGPAKAGAKAMAELGLKVEDAQGNMRSMPEILRAINTATKDMGNVQRKAILTRIFGAEAGSGMAELVSQMSEGGLDDLLEQIMHGTQGENARMAATMTDNIKYDLKGLVSAWEEVGISMTEANEGPIRQLIGSVTDFIRRIGQWINANPELVATLAKVVGVVGILAAVGGSLAITLASLIAPISLVMFGFGKMALAAKLVAPALMGGLKLIPLLGKAVLALVKTIVTGLIKAVMLAGKALLIFTKTALAAAAKGVVLLGKAFLVLGKAILANPIVLAIAAVALAAYLLWKNWDGVVGGLKALWADLADSTRFIWEPILAFFSDFCSDVAAVFSGGLAGLGALILNWSPLGLFYQAFAGVLSWFGVDLPGKFTEFGGMLMSGMVQGIKNGLGSVREAITGAGDQAIGWFKDKLGIRSPSRVFAALGDDTMAGLRVGLQRSQSGPLGTVLETGKQLAKAGALALGIGGAGQALAIDSRPALQAGQAPIVVQGDTITIQITAAPGSNSAELESMINRVLDQRERGKAARIRSALYDTD